MAVKTKLPPVNERTYRPADLRGALAKTWYARGARAGASGKYASSSDAWNDYREKYPSAHAAVSGSAVYAIQEYFYGGYNDGERMRGRKVNPGAWLKASAVRVIRDGRGRAIRLDIRKPARRRRK